MEQHNHSHSHSPNEGHAHAHSHSHSHGLASDAASANREHYDADAAQYDREDRIELARRLTPHILAAHSFDEDKTRLLDYACGTGLISQSLAPYTAQIVGVDISSGMVAQYNQRVADQGIPLTEMRAVVATPENVNLADELGESRFDVAVCSMAYHHITDIAGTTQSLANVLQPGGTLIVIDIFDHPDEDPSNPLFQEKYHAVVPHRHGFDEATISHMFKQAELDQFEMKRVLTIKMHGQPTELFLAKGVRTEKLAS